jgi:hypothetical protein
MAEDKNWIQGAIKRPGAFTAKAEEAGKSTAEYAREVTAHPEKYEKRTVRQARLAQTLSKLRKRREERRQSRGEGRREEHRGEERKERREED